MDELKYIFRNEVARFTERREAYRQSLMDIAKRIISNNGGSVDVSEYDWGMWLDYEDVDATFKLVRQGSDGHLEVEIEYRNKPDFMNLKDLRDFYLRGVVGMMLGISPCLNSRARRVVRQRGNGGCSGR